jgi:TnpA family transposase
MPPARFLSDSEIERLQRFPETIAPDALAEHFRLSAGDLAFLREQHTPAGQLGIAVQLGALRWLGFVPEDLTAAPEEAISRLATPLDVPARAIFEYSVRPQTRREHRVLVRAHAGFRPGGERELDEVRGWAVQAALEHDRPSLLLTEICGELHRRQIERPAVAPVMRLVGWSRERAHEVTYDRLAEQLTAPLCDMLDALLTVDDGGRSRHAWLRERPTTTTLKALQGELEKRAFLIEEIGANRLDLSDLSPNRRAWLAQIGRQQTNQALARMAPQRRYPVLVCFCVEALERATDDALEIYIQALGSFDRAAERRQDELDRHARRDTRATIARFVDLATVILDAQQSGADVMRVIDRRIGIERLREYRDSAQRIDRPADGHQDLLVETSGAAVRKFLAEISTGVELHRTSSDGDGDELLSALRAVRAVAGTTQRWLPGHLPSGFIEKAWRAHVVDSARGRLDRRAYEVSVAYELRAALRAGRVWVPHSRCHTDPVSMLLPAEQWLPIRGEFARTTGRPLEIAERLADLAEQQHDRLARLAEVRDAESLARLQEDGLLTQDPPPAGDAGDERRLRRLIEPRLPELDLAQLLIEVDRWTGFSRHLTPVSGNRARSQDLPAVLYAVIVAQATNLGLAGMARASRFSYQQLEWAWEQFCREPALIAASATLVDYQHALPLAEAWGTGRLSSSDGQRFATRNRAPGTSASPRYFGHRRRGLQIYTWTSDQYSQYASKVIPTSVRDALHTLDGILDNQTVLGVETHTSDTHGYTEMIFGAYDLLGLTFAPRIRDLDRQQLYALGTLPAVETAALLKQRLRPEVIEPHWDELQRLAASLKHGWAPASLLLARLQAGSKRQPLARSLQEYGRLVKTNFVLAYLADQELQRLIDRQLNKGEQAHALRRAIFYANEGHLQHANIDGHSEQALCLAILVNAIIAWNTVCIQRVLDQIQAGGAVIASSDLARLSPLPRQHINLYGRHTFDIDPMPGGHRPLRTPDRTTAPPSKTSNRV